ncbi:CaiB/BaiF CoA-transferase family protein [Piscinibacter sp. XHJ-5]|uniref:CaiB/BaiF CoA transferase family protein n=1 Tax=Piscinibacter sp. XHJ-5 TaxID=3037797 RepID=UPI0024532E21|nr:CaiB/BaiF CoA-transferase family protein [Piscinibacter sp. XHJ-5]
MSGLLSNIRVLDLSRVLSGPWATQMLADFGAHVIKVERPGIGDDLRQQGARLKDTAGNDTDERSTFLATNRAKRSITIDMAQPAGQSLIRRLAEKADVVVENFKAGDLKRYGLDQQSLRELNPRLVYCSISGFGQSGPYSHLPGYDLIFQAMSGVMSLTGAPEGEPGAGPQRAGYPVSDLTAGFYATIGVLAALHHRDTVSGRGQYIDLSLLDAQVAAVSSMAMSYLVAGVLPQRVGLGSQLTAPYGDFDCADGKMMIAVGNDKQFAQLCKVIGRTELLEDERFSTTSQRVENKQVLLPIVAGAMKQRTMAEWMPLLSAANVPSGPINDFRQVFDDPQIRHRELVHTIPHPLAGTMKVVGNPLKFSETPLEYKRPPPLLGEHTAEVLRDLLGIDDAEIERLTKQGVVTQ